MTAPIPSKLWKQSGMCVLVTLAKIAFYIMHLEHNGHPNYMLKPQLTWIMKDCCVFTARTL